MRHYIYKINGLLPLDINHCYGYNRRAHRRFIYPSAREYKDNLKDRFKLLDNKRKPPKFDLHSVAIWIFIPPKLFFLKDGKRIRNANDSSNFIKLIEDAYFEYLGTHDAGDLFISSSKRVSPDEEWHIIISVTEGIINKDVIHVLNPGNNINSPKIKLIIGDNNYGSKETLQSENRSPYMEDQMGGTGI
jgi:hypothetical protein